MRSACIFSVLLCLAAVGVRAQQSDTGQTVLTVRSTLVQVPVSGLVPGSTDRPRDRFRMVLSQRMVEFRELGPKKGILDEICLYPLCHALPRRCGRTSATERYRQ